MTKYTPMTRANCVGLESLQGAQLLGVTYHYLPPADRRGYAGGEKGVDCDLAAVALDLGERGTMTITWAMAGELQGLAILNEERYTGTSIDILDATDRDAWRERIGDEVTSVAASWQTSGGNCPESIWAVRICFATESIVIALGMADPDLEYMPDELVVVFDLSLARSYKPNHVSQSSFGPLVEPM